MVLHPAMCEWVAFASLPCRSAGSYEEKEKRQESKRRSEKEREQALKAADKAWRKGERRKPMTRKHAEE